MPPVPSGVERSHFVVGATPREVYDVVVDFSAYPRLFPDLTAVSVLQTEGKRVRAEFRASVLVAVRYVLDLVCDPEVPSVEWTFVEGEVVSNSTGGWRFAAEGNGTRVHYHAALEVRAPLPGFILRKISDVLLAATIPNMFASLSREVLRRQQRRG